MPQLVDPLVLASAYGIPFRQVASLEDLPSALEWSLALSRTVLLRVCTNSDKDAELRKSLRHDLINHLKIFGQNEENNS